jgi:hypothetical protein
MIKVDPGAIVFTSGISPIKIACGGETNYCWAIDRKSHSYDDIHGMIMYIGITSVTSRPAPACIYYYYSTNQPTPGCIYDIKFMTNRATL